MRLRFEWDEDKAIANIQKHGVSFEEAQSVFGDLNSVTLYDSHHSDLEERFIDIGLSVSGRLLVVVYTERSTSIVLLVVDEQQFRGDERMNNHMNNEQDDTDEMQSEYDFSRGIRGKHAHAYQQGYSTTIHKADGSIEERVYGLPEGAVMLDVDVRTYFPDADAVNAALRGLIQLIPHERLPHA